MKFPSIHKTPMKILKFLILGFIVPIAMAEEVAKVIDLGTTLSPSQVETLVKKLISDQGFYSIDSKTLLIYDEEKNATKIEKLVLSLRHKEAQAVIPLKSISFASIEKLIHPKLSNFGSLGFLENENAVIVYDTPEKIEQIKQMIDQVDRPRLNVRVLVDFVGNRNEESVNIGVGLGKSQDGTLLKMENGRIVDHALNGFSLKGSKLKSNLDSNRQMQLLVQSGKQASLFVGTEELDPVQLSAYFKSHRLEIFENGAWRTYQWKNDQELNMRRIGASMQIQPFAYQNGKISVDVFPQFSVKDRIGKEQSVRIEELVSTVQVEEGQKIHLGSLMQNKKGNLSQIFSGFGWNNSSNQSFMNVYLTAYLK